MQLHALQLDALHFHALQFQPHEVEKLLVAELGDPVLAAGADDVFSDFLLAIDEGVDALLDGADADELVDDDVLFLADAEGAVGGLVLDGGVPPAVKMDHVVGAGEVEAGAARFDGEDHEGDIFFPVEFLHHLLAALHAGAPVQDESLRVEDLLQEPCEVFRDLAVLGEDEDALAFS